MPRYSAESAWPRRSVRRRKTCSAAMKIYLMDPQTNGGARTIHRGRAREQIHIFQCQIKANYRTLKTWKACSQFLSPFLHPEPQHSRAESEPNVGRRLASFIYFSSSAEFICTIFIYISFKYLLLPAVQARSVSAPTRKFNVFACISFSAPSSPSSLLSARRSVVAATAIAVAAAAAPNQRAIAHHLTGSKTK